MGKFPRDAAKRRVIATLEILGFELVRDHEHVQMRRREPNGSVTPLTMPAHRLIKGSTLRMICTQAGIGRDEFLDAFEKAR